MFHHRVVFQFISKQYKIKTSSTFCKKVSQKHVNIFNKLQKKNRIQTDIIMSQRPIQGTQNRKLFHSTEKP